MNIFRRNRSKIEKPDNDLAFKKYDLLIKARNFHYENYNKWMSYFYIINAALFVGYYTIVTKSFELKIGQEAKTEIQIYSIAISVLGFIIGILWFLANKGYYYWNIQFITLVNHYEKNILKFPEKERVYFVSLNKNAENMPYSPYRGANFSTSKISIFISYLFTYVWALLVNFNLIKLTEIIDKCCLYIIGVLIPVLYILLLTAVLSKLFKSNNNHFPDLKIGMPENNLYQPGKEYTT